MVWPPPPLAGGAAFGVTGAASGVLDAGPACGGGGAPVPPPELMTVLEEFQEAPLAGISPTSFLWLPSLTAG